MLKLGLKISYLLNYYLYRQRITEIQIKIRIQNLTETYKFVQNLTATFIHCGGI